MSSSFMNRNANTVVSPLYGFFPYSALNSDTSAVEEAKQLEKNNGTNVLIFVLVQTKVLRNLPLQLYCP